MFKTGVDKGISWLDVKYIEELSSFIFSTVGIQLISLVALDPCPFLIIVIGFPLLPAFDQLLSKLPKDPLVVLPNLIELPHLPSTITSPADGSKGFTVLLGSNVPPTNGEL